MTYTALYHWCISRMEEGGCDSAAFDAACLMESLAGVRRAALPLRETESVPDSVLERVMSAAERRAGGYPLQYILGEWDFLTLTLEVGEGVLIPRADTEILVETAAELLRGTPSPKVLDLCSGSGCIALGLSSLCSSASITAVELSPLAMTYLERNCARYPQYAVRCVSGDVLNDAKNFNEMYNAILSNPPYISSVDLPLLMREVQHEPSMALDGGDGLVFYRSIARDWCSKLLPGGFCAVEVGIGQADAVWSLFQNAGLTDVRCIRDLSGIERVVIGTKP